MPAGPAVSKPSSGSLQLIGVEPMKELGRRFLWIYLTLTLCFALALGVLLLRYGSAAFYAIQTPSSSSTPVMNFVVFSVSWLFIRFVDLLEPVS
jgi:hypothetical protein